MKCPKLLFAALTLAVAAPAAGQANDRYATRPPVVLSPDLSAPWVMQLRAPASQGQQVRRIKRPRTLQTIFVGTGVGIATTSMAPDLQPLPRKRGEGRVTRVAATPGPDSKPEPEMDPRFLPTVVDYDGGEKPGTIVINTAEKFLYLVEADGKAQRYGVGVGKEGFGWSGTETISRKREWPEWRPPAEMIERVKKKEGRILPAFMDGGPANPLGARAMYLGSTLYRIHGTNQPWTIGTAVSSGCIRMRNEDVSDLYDRVKIGTKVIVR